MRSNVASHKRACSSVRLGSCCGTRKFEAFMTRRTFLSSSGTASNCATRTDRFLEPAEEKNEVDAPSDRDDRCA